MESHQVKHGSWELPDCIWQRMEPLIPPRKSRMGRPTSADFRRISEGIFYVLRPGIQWQTIPRERFGPPSTVYYYFAQWVRAGVFEKLWAEALAVYDDLKGLEWTWQSIDGVMTKAPLGGSTGANPTDHGKQGTKRSLLTEGKGIPMAVVVAGANRHDMKLFADTLDALVVEQPEPSEEEPQHLCADKAYDCLACRKEAERRGYLPHIRAHGEERVQKAKLPGYRARRWVVQVCHSWLKRFPKILVRFEKNDETHLGLLQFACAYIVFKRSGSF